MKEIYRERFEIAIVMTDEMIIHHDHKMQCMSMQVISIEKKA